MEPIVHRLREASVTTDPNIFPKSKYVCECRKTFTGPEEFIDHIKEGLPKSAHASNGCDYCDFIRLTYPDYHVDNGRALVFILKHLGLDHHSSIEAGDPGISR